MKKRHTKAGSASEHEAVEEVRAGDSNQHEIGASDRDDDKKRISVIFNPVSGKSDPRQRRRAISEALAGHGYTCQFVDTTPEHSAKEAAENAVKAGVSLIAVSGGDGTVMEVLSALIGTNIPVAVLPAGTGNLLSVNLGIPTTLPEAVDVAISGKPYTLDLAVTADGHHFAIMGGIGLDGKVIQDADREAKNRFGVLAYVGAVLTNLARRRVSFEITLDDKAPLYRRAKSVVIANMGKITGGVEAIPTASPTDGLLDIGIVKAHTFGQGIRLVGYTLLGRAHEAPDLEVYQARRVHIRSVRHAEPVQVDGEENGQAQDLSVEVIPGAACILIPVNAPSARDRNESREISARRTAPYRLLAPILLVVALAGLTGFWLVRRKRRQRK